MRFVVHRLPACLALALAVVTGCTGSETPTELDVDEPEPESWSTIVTAPSSGQALLRVFQGSGSQQSYRAYPLSYMGGVNLAVGDVNGDGVDDVVVGVSAGLPQVRVIDGSRTVQGEASGDAILADFLAFAAEYAGGVTVATGDVNDDGVADIIVGAASGAARVRVVDGSSAPGSGEVSGDAVLADFFAFPLTYTGGVTVASGDVNGDGRDDVVIGAATGTSHVRVVEGRAALAADGVLESGFLANFFAFSPSYTGGVNVASGDVDGDGSADVVVGAATGTPQVRVVDSDAARAAAGVVDDAGLLAEFFPFTMSHVGGVSIAAGDITGDGRADVVTGVGEGNALAHVRAFDGSSLPSGVADAPSDWIVEILAYAGVGGPGVNVATGR